MFVIKHVSLQKISLLLKIKLFPIIPCAWWINMGNHPCDLTFNPTSHSCLLEPSKQLSQLISYNLFCLSTKPWLLISSVNTVSTVFYLPEIP